MRKLFISFRDFIVLLESNVLLVRMCDNYVMKRNDIVLLTVVDVFVKEKLYVFVKVSDYLLFSDLGTSILIEYVFKPSEAVISEYM